VIRPLSNGLFREVSSPQFGVQDTGQCPGGPQDRFSWECARILLDGSPECRSWELVLPPEMKLLQDCVGVVTGGELDQVTCGGRRVAHATVFEATAGECIQWGIRRRGYRTLLALTPSDPASRSCVGGTRGSFHHIARWTGSEGVLRVLPGPEAGWLKNVDSFLHARWTTSLSSSDEGLRLEGGPQTPYRHSLDTMVSAPVTDGTVQLTPNGPILLLRSRPTVGGYPRVFTVIDADVDLAAQIPPRRRIRFCEVTQEEAVRVKRQQLEDLQRLAQSFHTGKNNLTDRH